VAIITTTTASSTAATTTARMCKHGEVLSAAMDSLGWWPVELACN